MIQEAVPVERTSLVATRPAESRHNDGKRVLPRSPVLPVVLERHDARVA